MEYDLQQREAATKSSRTSVQPTFTASQYRALSVLGCGHTSSTKCYGCASAVTEHCITLLRALATNPALRHILVSQGLVRELFDYNLRRGSAAMREEVRQLMCLLTRSEPAPGAWAGTLREGWGRRRCWERQGLRGTVQGAAEWTEEHVKPRLPCINRPWVWLVLGWFQWGFLRKRFLSSSAGRRE